MESYLRESVGVITLDEADLSKDEARKDEENRKDGEDTEKGQGWNSILNPDEL